MTGLARNKRIETWNNLLCIWKISWSLNVFFSTFTTYFRCPGESMELCNIMRELLHIGAYVDLVQNTLVQAQVNIIFFL